MDGASEYLARLNFNSLIEWCSAEVLLNRPSGCLRCLLDDLIWFFDSF